MCVSQIEAMPFGEMSDFCPVPSNPRLDGEVCYFFVKSEMNAIGHGQQGGGT